MRIKHSGRILACALVIGMLGVLALSALAQRQPLSPKDTVNFTLNEKKVTIVYCRPYIRHPQTGEPRKIMGDLVPYDQVWRTGANAATSLVTEANLLIGGVTVPAGSYTLYTLPGPNSWKLIVNKQTGQWGTEYNESQDLARIDMKVGKTSATVDPFTISIDPTPKGGLLKLEWENTRASVEFSEKK